MHKSTCIEKGTLYTCTCKSGYRGKQCREKDPCKPNPCQNGICADMNGLTACNCTRGWMGESCESKCNVASNMIHSMLRVYLLFLLLKH